MGAAVAVWVRSATMKRLTVLLGCFLAGMCFTLVSGGAGSQAEAQTIGNPFHGTYPDNGMLWMSNSIVDPYTRGSLTVGTNECTTANKYGRATRDVIAGIAANSKGGRYVNGIQHQIYCVGVYQKVPPSTTYVLNGPANGVYEYFSGDIPLASGAGPIQGDFLGSSIPWDLFLWWTDTDPNSGGLNHHVQAKAPFCGIYGYDYPCGFRDVMQLSRTRYANRTEPETQQLMVHELLHPQGLHDCDTGISNINWSPPSPTVVPSVLGNSICGTWVGRNNPLAGWPLLDRQLIDKIYGPAPPQPPGCVNGLILWDSQTNEMSPAAAPGVSSNLTFTNWNNRAEYVGRWPGCAGAVYDVAFSTTAGFGRQLVPKPYAFSWSLIGTPNAVSGFQTFN